MARVIGIGVNGIDAEDEFRHPILWASDRGAGSVDCFRGSVPDPLINPVTGVSSMMRFDVVYARSYRPCRVATLPEEYIEGAGFVCDAR